jgi:hypothetical protein
VETDEFFPFSFFASVLLIKKLPTVVEQVTGRDHVLNHLSIPAACFTHPEISMVRLTEVYQNFHCNEYCNEPVLFHMCGRQSLFFSSATSLKLCYSYNKITSRCPSVEVVMCYDRT